MQIESVVTAPTELKWKELAFPGDYQRKEEIMKKLQDDIANKKHPIRIKVKNDVCSRRRTIADNDDHTCELVK